MNNGLQHKENPLDPDTEKDMVDSITLKKYEVINILKTLEGLKKKLQSLLKA